MTELDLESFTCVSNRSIYLDGLNLGKAQPLTNDDVVWDPLDRPRNGIGPEVVVCKGPRKTLHLPPDDFRPRWDPRPL